ncbi:hypothetical protein GGD64_008279 [Bradyrhizobium sp. CIR3A]|nr:hypothetical protein [Bradyrhizobium sp. CIR3A]
MRTDDQQIHSFQVAIMDMPGVPRKELSRVSELPWLRPGGRPYDPEYAAKIKVNPNGSADLSDGGQTTNITSRRYFDRVTYADWIGRSGVSSLASALALPGFRGAPAGWTPMRYVSPQAVLTVLDRVEGYVHSDLARKSKSSWNLSLDLRKRRTAQSLVSRDQARDRQGCVIRREQKDRTQTMNLSANEIYARTKAAAQALASATTVHSMSARAKSPARSEQHVETASEIYTRRRAETRQRGPVYLRCKSRLRPEAWCGRAPMPYGPSAGVVLMSECFLRCSHSGDQRRPNSRRRAF